MSQSRIGIKELRDTLSATIARVKRGEAVTVTERNEPVAVILPVREQTSDDEALWQAVRDGMVSWSGGHPAARRRRPLGAGEPVSAAVMEDRG
ncbi:MAG: hypothetical protein AMXMBFR64_50540 [Myxococcales bacterium]